MLSLKRSVLLALSGTTLLSLNHAMPDVIFPPAQAAITTHLKHKDISVRGEGNKAKLALLDARHKAIDFIVKDLVQTDSEREKLEQFLPTLHANAKRYVKRLKIEAKGTTASGGRFYTIRYRVDVQSLKEALVQQAVIPAQSELNEALNFPTLAVYFKDPLNTSEAALWSVQRCNSLLVDQGFQVIAPEVWQALGKEDLKLSQIVNPQRMALKAKANVFLEISIEPQVTGKSGDYTYVHTPVRIRAFEASSGQPFLDKFYARKTPGGEPEAFAIEGNLDTSTKVVVEEAVAGVMPMIVRDLSKHWKESLSVGRQYRLFFSEPLSQEQLTILKSKVKAYDAKAGEIQVRYAGELADLADELEEALEPHYVLQSVDLGQAHFHKAPTHHD